MKPGFPQCRLKLFIYVYIIVIKSKIEPNSNQRNRQKLERNFPKCSSNPPKTNSQMKSRPYSYNDFRFCFPWGPLFHKIDKFHKTDLTKPGPIEKLRTFWKNRGHTGKIEDLRQHVLKRRPKREQLNKLIYRFKFMFAIGLFLLI